MRETVFDEKDLIKDLKTEAKAIGIPTGAAEVFIEKTVKEVSKKLKNKKIITRNDLERAVGAELAKYNADFAYVYKNRDKII